ncbi:MAG TPA: SDR family oxidoreductase [Edaphocola sp.]|nr:SDR family oxidoreductase [Edaphocola sp.]
MIIFIFARIIILMTLKNKVVAITGASSGIGKALALDALSRGAKVAVCARNIEKLKDTYKSFSEILLVQADVSKKEDCFNFILAIEDKWDRIDILINNAGNSMRALFEDLDVKVLEELMAVNFWGTVYATKAALPSIIKNKGTIVGVSSIAGYRGLPGRTGYSASKFAMQGFLECLRTELLYKSVNVMWVAPGFTNSNIRNTALAADGNAQQETPLDESKLMSAEQCAQIILNGIEKRKRTIVMTTQGKLTVLLNKFFPKLMDKIVFNHFAKEADSPLKK